MIQLLIIGDGERDAVTVPRIVEQILSVSVREESRQWARLHSAGRGYGRKLQFAVRQARDSAQQGVVATVDADRSGLRRLRELRGTREKDRAQSPAFPTVLGCAVPHGEAWLLDDPIAVRRGLTLPPEADVPTVSKVTSPKKTLEDLLAQSPRRDVKPRTVWCDIASALEPHRCVHAADTGFRDFTREVHNELGPLRQL
jgi:hypothetical protein